MLPTILLSLVVGLYIRLGICLTTGYVPYRAPLYGSDHPDKVPNVYIVALTANYTINQHWQTIGVNLSTLPEFIHYDVLFGYSAEMNSSILDVVRSDPNVTFVETDANMLTHSLPTPSNAGKLNTSSMSQHQKRQTTNDYNYVIEDKAPWNLQVVGAGDKLQIPVENGKGDYELIYQAGRGVNIYIMDTGIRITHKLFQGRASNFGGLSSTDESPYVKDEIMDDLNGHGTHVAGIAGAQYHGVAQGANLINVKVVNEEGFVNRKQLIKAINDVSKDHQKNRKNLKGWDFRGSVINMSLGSYGIVRGIEWACIWARYHGVNIVGAAGNFNRDTNSWLDWPCYFEAVMCVAAIDSDYFKAPFSNHGESIGYLAPGDSILSLSNETDDAIKERSGCSMAAPHVAGIAAIFTSWKGLATGGASSYVYSNTLGGLTKGWPKSIWGGNTPNLLATTGIRSKLKYPKEPFRWASDDPAANAIVDGVVPVSNVTGTPPFAQQSDVVTLTTSGITSALSWTAGLLDCRTADLVSNSDRQYLHRIDDTSSTSVTASATSSSGICFGNQIEGSCTGATLPSATPDSGPQSPVCNKVDSSTGLLMFNATQASTGAYTYCGQLVSNKVVLSKTGTAPKPGYVPGAAENGGYIAMSVLFDVDSCAPGTSAQDQKFDFGSMTEEDCHTYVYSNIETYCSKDSTWSDYNPDYSIEGGVYGEGCAMWSMSGLSGSPPSE